MASQNPSYNNPRDKRLALDYFKLKELCEASEYIQFEIISEVDPNPPDKYLIHYNIRSIQSISDTGEPIYHDKFTIELDLPNGYPMMRSPLCYMKTDIWHPNVRNKGKFKGRICINEQNIGSWQTLDLLVLHIGQMIQYKNYHAKNIQPYPEDPEVAKWIREYAEPRDIISKAKGISTDNKILVAPSKEWNESRNMRRLINIRGVKLRGKSKNQIVGSLKKNKSSINIKLD